jgi:hypothetical protein
MTATAHALIGVTIAAAVHNPALAIPLAILSHIPCDLVPHWDAGTHFAKKSGRQLFGEALLDVIISVVSAVLLLKLVFPDVALLYGLIMAFAAQFLDYLAAPYYMFHLHVQPFTFVNNFQKKINNRLDKPWGIVTQAAVVLLCIILATFAR